MMKRKPLQNRQDAAKVKKSCESSKLLIRFLFLLTNSLVNAFLLFMLLLLPFAQLSFMSYSGVLSQSIYTRNGTMHFLIPGMSLMLDSCDGLILTSGGNVIHIDQELSTAIIQIAETEENVDILDQKINETEEHLDILDQKIAETEKMLIFLIKR